MNQNKKFAICYDFDCTLSTKYMYEYSLLPMLGYDNIDEIFTTIKKQSIEKDMNELMLSFYSIMNTLKEQNITLNDDFLRECGKDIDFFKGVDTWFNRISNFAQENDIEVEHFVISSGNEEIIRGCSIADKFKHIFGSKFMYDDNGIPVHLGNLLSPFDKIGYIHRISKGVFSHGYYPDNKDTYIPIKNMIYIGDGETDIPCMKEINSFGGNSILVYDDTSAENKNYVQNFYNEGYAKFIASADYQDGSELEKTVKNILINKS